MEMETRDDLLTISARVGTRKLTGVFDSGSQANIISEECALGCGLPIQVKDLGKVRISGIDGGLAKCVGIIPEAAIYVTDSNLETFGQLLVIRDAAFKLLLGRPWGTRNRAGIREAPEGTYLSFQSQGTSYEINVSPSRTHEQRIREMNVANYTRRPKWEPRSEIAVAAVSNNTIVPESEPDQDVPEEHRGNQMESFTLQGDGQSRSGESRGQEEEEEQQTSREADDELEERDRAVREWITPFKPIYHSPEDPSDAASIITIDKQEDYIWAVQEGISEGEWEKIYREEKRRQKRDRKKWTKTRRESKNLLQKYPRDPPEDASPETTILVEEEPPMQSSIEPVQKIRPRYNSEVTIERWSSRIRKESKRAKESEFWKILKKVAYERQDKRTREQMRTMRPQERTIASLGVVVTKVRDDEGKGYPTKPRKGRIDGRNSSIQPPTPYRKRRNLSGTNTGNSSKKSTLGTGRKGRKGRRILEFAARSWGTVPAGVSQSGYCGGEIGREGRSRCVVASIEGCIAGCQQDGGKETLVVGLRE